MKPIKPLPVSWRPLWPSMVDEFDVRIQPRARLRAKVIVFKSTGEMGAFWQRRVNRVPLGSRCLGAVNALSCQRERVSRDGSVIRLRPITDSRYFCVIGFVQRALCMEVVCHESVHAAFAYASRRRWGVPWGGINDGLPEETVCYPAGRIAAAINRELHNRGLYLPSRRS